VKFQIEWWSDVRERKTVTKDLKGSGLSSEGPNSCK